MIEIGRIILGDLAVNVTHGSWPHRKLIIPKTHVLQSLRPKQQRTLHFYEPQNAEQYQYHHLAKPPAATQSHFFAPVYWYNSSHWSPKKAASSSPPLMTTQPALPCLRYGKRPMVSVMVLVRLISFPQDRKSAHWANPKAVWAKIGPRPRRRSTVSYSPYHGSAASRPWEGSSSENSKSSWP